MEEYPDYIDENGMITIKWWLADMNDENYDDKVEPEETGDDEILS